MSEHQLNGNGDRNGPGHARPAGHRVAITGIGPITAVGTGKENFWEGLRRQRSPIRRITRFDVQPWRTRIAAEVDDFEPTDYVEPRTAKRMDRFGHFAVGSARLALADAGLRPDEVDPDRTAVQMGTALGGMGYAETQANAFYGGITTARAIDPRVALTTFAGAASCSIAIDLGVTGPNATNAMSCASGTIAVGEAWRLIRDGSADAALAGGIEAPLAPMCFGAFAVIRAMSTRNDDPEHACRPFDEGRDGFIMGEGACTLFLERYDHAIARGARIYAEVVGYGCTNDAYHMTAPRPDASQAVRAMRIALGAGDVAPEDVDLISPHGSSTPLNDSTESSAIKQLFGERAYRLPISGTKPYHAHALGASGAIEAAVCCLAFERGWAPPTLNFECGGDACDLDYISSGGRDCAPRYVLSNSFGFGGINAALVLARPGLRD